MVFCRPSLPGDIEALAPRAQLPDDIARSSAAARARCADWRCRGTTSARTTLIENLKLQIAKLKRMQFGRSSEKLKAQIEQLELIVEDLEATQAHAGRSGALCEGPSSLAGAPAAARAPAARDGSA
jgi:hypothetical protein